MIECCVVDLMVFWYGGILMEDLEIKGILKECIMILLISVLKEKVEWEVREFGGLL